jgi:hypothetical protein
MQPTRDIAPGRALWRALLDEETVPSQSPPMPEDLVERFCGLFGPALVANAAPGAVDAGLVKQARLLNKLSSRRQGQAITALLDRGHHVVAMKGFASSRLYHRDLEARITGDLDLLVTPGEIESIVGTLLRQGYAVTTDLPLPPWGFISEASFLPMTSSDGLVDIDLHVLADCYPLALGLSTNAVFERARSVSLAEHEIKIPCPEHMLLIALSNATKEKLGPQSVKSLLDCGRVLASEPTLDWTLVDTALSAARLETPARVTFAAIRYLRGETESGPWGNGFMAARFQSAMDDLSTGFDDGFSPRRKLEREIFLTAETHVVLRRLVDRLVGLVSKGRGIPPGAGQFPKTRGA